MGRNLPDLSSFPDGKGNDMERYDAGEYADQRLCRGDVARPSAACAHQALVAGLAGCAVLSGEPSSLSLRGLWRLVCAVCVGLPRCAHQSGLYLAADAAASDPAADRYSLLADLDNRPDLALIWPLHAELSSVFFANHGGRHLRRHLVYYFVYGDLPAAVPEFDADHDHHYACRPGRGDCAAVASVALGGTTRR